MRRRGRPGTQGAHASGEGDHPQEESKYSNDTDQQSGPEEGRQQRGNRRGGRGGRRWRQPRRYVRKEPAVGSSPADAASGPAPEFVPSSDPSYGGFPTNTVEFIPNSEEPQPPHRQRNKKNQNQKKKKPCIAFQQGTCQAKNCARLHVFDMQNELIAKSRFQTTVYVQYATLVSERTVAVVSDTGQIILFDFYSMNKEFEYDLNCSVNCLFHVDSYFITGSLNYMNKLLVVNQQTNSLMQYDCPDTPNAIELYINQMFFIGGCNGTLMLWDSGFNGLYMAQSQGGAITRIKHSGEVVLTTTSTGMILIWKCVVEPMISIAFCGNLMPSQSPYVEMLLVSNISVSVVASGQVFTMDLHQYAPYQIINVSESFATTVTSMSSHELKDQNYIILGTDQGTVIRYVQAAQKFNFKGKMTVFGKGDPVKGVFATSYGVLSVSSKEILFLENN